MFRPFYGVLALNLLTMKGTMVLSSTSLGLSLLLISGLIGTLAASPNATGPMVPALFVFGDSIVDTGNNNVLKTLIKANFPPYGVDFPGHKPTGRFCNGRVASDFIASGLRLKNYIPPYVGSNLSPEDILTGVTFASGGAGYDPLTSQLVSVLSLSQQIELFKEYKTKLVAVAGEKRATQILAEGLFALCTGSDDLANNYAPLSRNKYDPPTYANLLINYATIFLEELIQLGARKVGIVGIPPIGCVPSQRTVGGGIFRDCSNIENLVAKLFNSMLPMTLKKITAKHPHVKLVYVNIYDYLFDIIQNPMKYGIGISNKGCCGTGELEVSVLCNSLTATTCGDVSDYVFWDSYHPTEGTYKLLVDFVFKNYIDQLV